jgi:hypothetical protein
MDARRASAQALVDLRRPLPIRFVVCGTAFVEMIGHHTTTSTFAVAASREQSCLDCGSDPIIPISARWGFRYVQPSADPEAVSVLQDLRTMAIWWAPIRVGHGWCHMSIMPPPPQNVTCLPPREAADSGDHLGKCRRSTLPSGGVCQTFTLPLHRRVIRFRRTRPSQS